MNSFVRKRLSYANVLATLALFFAFSGGALAVKHYLISSTKQISPKVLKALKGNKGAAGATGAQGPTGTTGLQGAKGEPGVDGKEGERGPSDVYESALEVGGGAYEPGESKSISLAHLPPGSYVIHGEATIATSTANAGYLRCILSGPHEHEQDIALVDPPNHGSNTLDTVRSFTFSSETAVSLSCRESDNKWGFDEARLIAVRVDDQHTEVAKVE